MRVSENWLREWIDHGLSTRDLADRLTMAGLEVDAIEPAAEDFSGVVVGEVVSVEPHPDADKLSLCQVSDGRETVPVVCGAPNVFQGMRAPFARVGAVLPGDFRIRKAKLRGQTSQGMLCSAKELGLSDDAAGLMQLAAEAPVGHDFRDYLALDDRVIEIDLTPNRGDCLSMAGIAREVGALTGKAVCRPTIGEVDESGRDRIEIRVEDAADCPSYAGRVITGIDTRADTPVWLSERLRRAGVRPISPVVDVTNYVMLELGQPMHGFRSEAIRGDIHVRRARQGETITLLDEREIELTRDILVIADESGPVAMAGIMGGQGTAVTPETDAIFLESACFAPGIIAGRARRFGLHTDASHRYERGVDPALQRRALDRATALIQSIAGGRAGPVTVAQDASAADRPPINLRRERLHAVLGFALDDDVVTGMLERLDLAVSPTKTGWQATPPSFRFDLAIEEDLIEEVARIHGYDRIPVESLPADVRPGGMPEARVSEDRVKALLVERGYQEAITYSFAAPEVDRRLSGLTGQSLTNPISRDLATMRTTLWSGLVGALRHNANRQQERIRLFECGLRFIPQDTEIEQKEWIAGVAWGSAEPEQWDGRTRPVDFFDVKADVEALLAIGGAGRVRFVADSHVALHPGQSARIEVDGENAGWLGRIHPRTAEALDVPGTAYLFELPMATVTESAIPAYRSVSRFPAVRRDLAFVVDESLPADSLVSAARETAGAVVSEVRVFDVYQGKGVDSGRKSIALGLILQDSSRTLTDEDSDRVMRAVRDDLASRFGATVRDQ